MLNVVKNSITHFLSVKILFSVFSLFIVIFLGVLYWAFDAAYLAAFGIGPEVYSRPFFSSRLMNTWLVLTLLWPGVWLLVAGCSLFFIIKILIHYKIGGKSTNAERIREEKPIRYQKFKKFIDALEKSFTPPAALLLATLIFIIFILISMTYISRKAKELANNQINSYVLHDRCIDTFDDHNIGCYKIPDIRNSENLVILNDNKTLIFMSYEVYQPEGEAGSTKIFFVNLMDKSTNKILTRKFVRKSDGKL